MGLTCNVIRILVGAALEGYKKVLLMNFFHCITVGGHVY